MMKRSKSPTNILLAALALSTIFAASVLGTPSTDAKLRVVAPDAWRAFEKRRRKAGKESWRHCVRPRRIRC